MGAVCCCFPGRNVEETAASTSQNRRNCLTNFVQNIKTKYGVAFSRGGIHQSRSSDHAEVSLTNHPVPIVDSSRTETVVRGTYKETGNSSVIQEPRGEGVLQLFPDLINLHQQQIESKECPNESSVKYSSQGDLGSFYYSEQDYECPTCLEEYTLDNPKITTKCSHHYHLGCILEWMERSQTCPVCGKAMEFDELI